MLSKTEIDSIISLNTKYSQREIARITKHWRNSVKKYTDSRYLSKVIQLEKLKWLLSESVIDMQKWFIDSYQKDILMLMLFLFISMMLDVITLI